VQTNIKLSLFMENLIFNDLNAKYEPN